MRRKRWSDVRVSELRGLIGRGCALVLILWATAACNGDGTGSGLTLSVGFGLKQLEFTWTSVADADYYRLMESLDSGASFSQRGGQIAAGTTSLTIDIAVHRHDWANARYQLEACNTSGCTASNTVTTLSGLLQAIGYMKASNTEAADGFSGAVAVSGDGDTVVVGATGEDSSATGIDGTTGNNGALNAGAVYVYARDGAGVWTQQAYVKAANTEAADGFGGAVAVSGDGDTMVVGATGEDSSATGIDGPAGNNGALNAGAVYVYTRDTLDVWTQQAYVKASNTETEDGFGRAVAVSGDGDTVVVGATGEDSSATGIDGTEGDNNAIDSGAVYVYARDGAGVWTQQAYVKAANTEAADGFGGAVAVSGDGDTVVVGATGEDSSATGIDGAAGNNGALNAGAVYVYTRDGAGVWTQQAYVKAANTEAADGFGGAVALSSDGNTMVVGATGEDSSATGIDGAAGNNGALNAGAVYVYTRDGAGVWTQQAYVKASNTETEDGFGRAVAVSNDGDTVVVGATGEDSSATGIDGAAGNNGALNAGAVYVYTRDGAGVWTQQAYVKAANTEAADGFGGAVALSSDGNTMVVGATGEDSSATGIDGAAGNNGALNAGAVYVYTRDGAGVWTQQAYVKASNTETEDGFGRAVAVSSDGDTVVVGATGEDSSATGIDGPAGNNGALNAGAVYLY